MQKGGFLRIWAVLRVGPNYPAAITTKLREDTGSEGKRGEWWTSNAIAWMER